MNQDNQLYLQPREDTEILKMAGNSQAVRLKKGETPQEALVREVQEEELDTKIKVGNLIDTIEYDYPAFHLSMDCFWSEIVSGKLVLKEHEDAKWLTKAELRSVSWLPADIALIDKIEKKMKIFNNA